MPLLLDEMSISGLFLITAHQASDERGYLTKYYDKELFKEKGVNAQFCEVAEIMSYKGTLRGLHFQNNPSQARLIHVISGSIFNAAVDLRPASASFTQHECCFLSRDKAIFVPQNFANGFLAMEDNTIIACHYSDKYSAKNSGGIIWNDSQLNIPWPLDKLNCKLLVSEKDMALQTFERYKEDL
jgi:dTDP-4-dehydrorhamnose 3,5-epimerase